MMTNFEDLTVTTSALYLDVNKQDLLALADRNPTTDTQWSSTIDPATILLIIEVISQILAIYIDNCSDKKRLVAGVRERNRLDHVLLRVGLRKAYFSVKESSDNCPKIDVDRLARSVSSASHSMGETKILSAISELSV